MNLLINYGFGEPVRLALNSDSVLIGRSRVCDVTIDHSHVSRTQTRITRIDDNTFRVEDMRSANGTHLMLNGIPFPIDNVTVKAGATISLGQYVEVTIT